MTWLAVAIFACIPLGSWLGVWIGRSWGSLPLLRPHSVVAFRGPQIGIEARMYVQEITYGPEGTTAILVSRRPSKDTAP